MERIRENRYQTIRRKYLALAETGSFLDPTTETDAAQRMDRDEFLSQIGRNPDGSINSSYWREWWPYMRLKYSNGISCRVREETFNYTPEVLDEILVRNGFDPLS